MSIGWLRVLHLLGAAIWVGGMFFVHFALRPAAAALPPPQRLSLLAATLRRFLAMAGAAVVAVLASGALLLMAAGGMRNVAPAVHAMAALAVVMTLVYVYVVLVPYRSLRAAIARGDWPGAGTTAGRLRTLVAINLALGLVALGLGGFAH
jgi:uncharacterized membrane protein